MIKQLPLSVRGQHKSDVRTQFAALCYRLVDGKVQILMITSRRTKRWIVPKGWPMHGKTPADSAAQEAWEEAGVTGRVHPAPLGLYSYNKVLSDAPNYPCVAVVYALHVTSREKKFPEVGQRMTKWVSRKKAANMVQEPELARILRDFNPGLLG